jgi:hypothetical protein
MRVSGGQVIRFMCEEFQVEAGPSHHDGEFPPGGNILQKRKSDPSVEGGVKGVGGVGDAVEVMRNQIPVFLAG